MASQRQPTPRPVLVVENDRPLIGVLPSDSDADTVIYFTDEDEAEQAVTSDVIRDALSLAGAWSDVPWQEIEASLDRIRHESQPSEPLNPDL